MEPTSCEVLSHRGLEHPHIPGMRERGRDSKARFLYGGPHPVEQGSPKDMIGISSGHPSEGSEEGTFPQGHFKLNVWLTVASLLHSVMLCLLS